MVHDLGSLRTFLVLFLIQWLVVLPEPISSNDGSCDAKTEGESQCGSSIGDSYDEMPLAPSKNRDWRWKPEAKHPCNINRLTYDELFRVFGSKGLPPLHHSPVVILNDPKSSRYDNIIRRTSQENIVAAFPPNFNVTLTSSNSFSANRRTATLAQYVQEVLSSETTPDDLSNETWYLFGETYTDEWQELLKDYELPPCQMCTRESIALSFGIGNKGSGAQWHTHGPGFSHALHGRKHWVMYPPDKKPVYHPDQTSRYWMEHVYTNLATDDLPFECTLEPGDMVYFPDEWHHAIINLDRYTAFVSSFTTEHVH